MNAASLLVVLCFLPGQAAQPEPSRSAKAIEAFRAEAAEYVVRLASRPQEKLVLEKEAALRWDNPARTGEDGALFVWTLHGRPEMIGTIFTYRFKDTLSRKHEVHSLATGPLAAEFRGKQVWAPAKAGVVFQPVKGAPSPAANPRQRLSQMKTLARDFSVSMTDAEGQYQLRLLAQPLVRYEPQDKQVQDGALFAFSLGTDPEAILLFETRQAKDAFEWQFAFARFHYIELKAQHQGREVWRVPSLPSDIMNLDIGQAPYQDSVYTTYHFERGIPVTE